MSSTTTSDSAPDISQPDPFNSVSEDQDSRILDNPDLCERCQSIDIAYILQTLGNFEDRDYISSQTASRVFADLGCPLNWPSECTLCHLFRTIHVNGYSELDDQTEYVLSKFLYKGVIVGLEMRPKISPPEGYLHDSGFICHVGKTKKSWITIPKVDVVHEHVDFQQLRSWIFLDAPHWETPLNTPRSLSANSKDFLRLIDCANRTVISAPAVYEYAALSYIWGLGDRLASWSSQLPPQLPLVIEDAITLTLQVGIKYLWVDRYCIKQDDDEDKARQIGRMDEVYRCASFTIIAAAGSDPSHGLPGISKSRSLNFQPIVTINDTYLTWSLPDCSKILAKSAWNTRAWTYQEMVFSDRRLVFTDLQVYWLVGETLHRSEALPASNDTRLGEHIANSNFKGNTRDKLLGHIQKYSERQLSYHSDIINGMRGIFETAVREIRSGPRHFWGLLLRPDSSWEDDDQFIVSLCWTHLSNSERQFGYPSWSWTGWKGAVQFELLSSIYKQLSDLEIHHQFGDNNLGLQQMPKREASLRVEGLKRQITNCSLLNRLTDWILPRQITNWRNLSASLATGAPYTDWTYILNFEGYIAQCEFIWLYSPPPHSSVSHMPNPSPGIFVKCQKYDNIYSPLHISGEYGGESSKLLSGKWDCLVVLPVTNTKIGYDIKDYCLLVLKWHGNIAERIGFLNLTHRIWDDKCEQTRSRQISYGATPYCYQPVKLEAELKTIRLG